MSRSEKLILVRELPSTIVTALDAVLEAQGYQRVAAKAISEDFTPLLHEPEGPLAFVLSPVRDEWVACFSSLEADAEADLSAALARGLGQPLIYALFDADRGLVVYRYFENGDLREESLPGGDGEQLDEAGLLAKLAAHGVDVALVDDRAAGFGAEHLVVGYTER